MRFGNSLKYSKSKFGLAGKGLIVSVCMLTIGSAVAFSAAAETQIPFKYVAGHVLVIPVRVCDHDSFFIFDTGAGVNIISQSLAAKLSCKANGSHSGRRMSGQRLKMETTNLQLLQVGSCLQKNVPAGIWNLDQLLSGEPELSKVEGFVSLEFFKDTPFTIDYKQKQIFIETDSTLKRREKAGYSVPIRVIPEHRIATGISLPMSFSNGKTAKVEVDTGSGGMILDARYMKFFAVKKNAGNTKTVEGKDETGHSYVRYFSEVPIEVFLSAAPKIRQSKPRVQFQKIIYDGIVGDSFMHNFIVTYDLPRKRMIFAPIAESNNNTD